MNARTWPLYLTWSLLVVVLFVLLLSTPVLAGPAAVLTVCPAGPPDCDHDNIQDAVSGAAMGGVIQVAGDGDAGGKSDLVQYSPVRGGRSVSRGLLRLDNQQPCRSQRGLVRWRTLSSGDQWRGGWQHDHGQRGELPRRGGAYVSAGDLAITGNTIVNNHAAFFGGGLYLTGTIGTVSSNAVVTNTAWQGGGLMLENSPMAVTGNGVAGNVLAEDTGWGAGIVLWHSDATLTQNRISHNVGYWSGGGVAIYNSDATLEGNTVVHNAARFGGGIHAEHSDASLANTIVADNQATEVGGGVWVSGYGSAWLAHSTVARNTAGDGSGPSTRAITGGGNFRWRWARLRIWIGRGTPCYGLR